MAITSGFFNSLKGDRKYNADDVNAYFEGLVGSGVVESVGNALVVKANNTMGVSVGTGKLIDSKGRWMKNTAVLNLTIDAADVTLNRYDAIVVKINASSAKRTAEIYVKKGMLATSPTKPAIVQTENEEEYCLAYVYVRANSSVITQGNIIDTRLNSEICGFVTGLIKQLDTTDLFIQWTAEFNAWFEKVKETLKSATIVRSYNCTQWTTKDTLTQVPIGIPTFNKELDILNVYINDLRLIPGIEYQIVDDGHINLSRPVELNTPVSFEVFKCEGNLEELTLAGMSLNKNISKDDLVDILELSEYVPATRTIAGFKLDEDINLPEFTKKIVGAFNVTPDLQSNFSFQVAYALATAITNGTANQEVYQDWIANSTKVQQNASDIRTLVEDVDNLSNITSDGIICAASGESIHIKDASDKRLVSQKVFGKSTQFTTTGAQLLSNDGNLLAGPDGMVDEYKSTISSVIDVRNIDTVFLSGDIKTLNSSLVRIGGAENIPQKGSVVERTEWTSVGLKDVSSYNYILVSFSIYGTNTTLEDINEGFMLNPGTTALPWEPYTGGISSPNPNYPQEIESTGDRGSIEESILGANLIPKIKVDTTYSANGLTMRVENNKCVINGESTYNYARIIDDTLKLPRGTYFVSGGKFGDSVYTQIAITKNGKTTYHINTKFTIDGTEDSIRCTVQTGDKIVTLNNYEIYPRVTIGDVALPIAEWKTYKNQMISLSTPDGLHGIPVSSDGNYTDENGQQWICDTIERYADGTGKRIQRTSVWQIKSTDLIGIDENSRYISHVISSELPTGISSIKAMCTHFKYNAFNWNWGSITIADHRICIGILNSGISTTQEWREWLNAQEEAGKPVIVIYALKTPIETQLTAEELAEFEKLHTYKSTTNITTDCDAGIEIEYVADTKTYIDNKFNELATAMIASGGES